VGEVDATGGRALALRANASDETRSSSSVRARARVVAARSNLLVNNVGVGPCHPRIEMEIAGWQPVLAVNLTGRSYARGSSRVPAP
jgi:NAD(P)-dependent dehydrogenase (short-subunit alcohol dehydrogenase family)